MQKRGQVTVFIIIGLILLILAGVFIMMRQQAAEEEPPEIVPEQLFPIKSFVDSCVRSASRDALDILGLQGGYIQVPESIRYDPLSYLPLTSDSTATAMKIPYWYYRGRNVIPSVDDMNLAIARYVEGNIGACLEGLAQFSDQYEINRTGNITAKASIGDKAVQVKVKAPMTVRILGEEGHYSISQFFASQDAPVMRMFTLAKEMLAAENAQMFFEKTTIDLMTLGPDIPFTDLNFKCGRMTWLLPQVKRDIQDLLYYNLPKIRVRNTDHLPFIAPAWKYAEISRYTAEDIAEGNLPKDVPPDVYDYFHNYWDATDNDYSDLKVNVYFSPEWNFQLRSKPAKGDVLRSDTGRGMRKYLPFLCINSYHFTYDMEYPVKIAIRDDGAFKGEGYTFQYAFPVRIRNNQGDRADNPIALYEAPEGVNLEACNARGRDVFYIYTKDAYTGEDIKGTNITFNCMDTIYCRLGQTDAEAGVYRLGTTLPSFCSPGSFMAENNDYLPVSASVGREARTQYIDMVPLKKLAVRGMKQRLSAGELLDPEALEQGEQLAIFITSYNHPEYDYYAIYPFDDKIPSDMRTLAIPDEDAVYDLNIILLRSDKVMIGGYRGNWTVGRGELESTSGIIFKALEKIPHPASDEDTVSLFGMIEDEDNLNRIRPVIG